jgi:hypothetical protein
VHWTYNDDGCVTDDAAIMYLRTGGLLHEREGIYTTQDGEVVSAKLVKALVTLGYITADEYPLQMNERGRREVKP